MVYDGLDFSTYGTDSRGRVTGPDLDWSWTPRGGDGGYEAAMACLEILARKLGTVPGSMDDDAWGLDLRADHNAGLRPADLAARQARVRAAFLDEEFVEDTDVTAFLSASDGKLVYDCRVSLADLGTYDFAFALSATGVQLVLGAGSQVA